MAQTQVRSGQAQQIALQNQEMLRYQEDQQKFADAYRATNGDISRLPGEYIQRGGRPALLGEWQKQHAGIVHSLAQGDLAQTEATAKRHDALGGEFKAFEAEPDEQKKAANWQPTLQRLHSEGRLTDQELAGYPAQYPGSDALKNRIMGFNTESQLMTQAAAKQRADAAALRATEAQRKNDLAVREFDAKQPELAAKGETATRANIAARLELAAHRGDEEYMDAYHAAGGEKYPELPTPQEYDKEKTPDLLRTWGLTPQQRTTANTAQQRVDETAANNKIRQDDAAQRLQLSRDRMARESVQTRNSEEINRRDAERRLRDAAVREGKIYRERQSLLSALKSGNPVTDKNGIPRDLQAEYADTTKELEQIIADKYAAYDYTKRPPPTVSYEDAVGAIHAGDESVLNPNGATKSPAATPPKPSAPGKPAAAARPASQAQTPLSNLQQNAQGHQIGWDGKNWVDAKTRQPIK